MKLSDWLGSLRSPRMLARQHHRAAPRPHHRATIAQQIAQPTGQSFHPALSMAATPTPLASMLYSAPSLVSMPMPGLSTSPAPITPLWGDMPLDREHDVTPLPISTDLTYLLRSRGL